MYKYTRTSPSVHEISIWNFAHVFFFPISCLFFGTTDIGRFQIAVIQLNDRNQVLVCWQVVFPKFIVGYTPTQWCNIRRNIFVYSIYLPYRLTDQSFCKKYFVIMKDIIASVQPKLTFFLWLISFRLPLFSSFNLKFQQAFRSK